MHPARYAGTGYAKQRMARMCISNASIVAKITAFPRHCVEKFPIMCYTQCIS